MQDFINAWVKGREWFRPLAPIVLAGAAPQIFEIDRPAPFMQIAADVRPEYRDTLPAITHVDGTARLQTVDDEAPFIRDVLTCFEARTGCPVLLNTSLNEKGDPIVETPAEAVHCLTATAITRWRCRPTSSSSNGAARPAHGATQGGTATAASVRARSR